MTRKTESKSRLEIGVTTNCNAKALVDADSLDQIERRFRFNDIGQLEASLRQEVAVFLLGAFAAAGEQHHFEIDDFGEMRFVAGSHHGFDQKQMRAWCRGGVNVLKDGERVRVVPVMNDVFHDVGVAGRNSLEKISVCDAAAAGKSL